MPLPHDFRLPHEVRPERYALRFELDLEAWRFRGTERVALALDGPQREIALHARDIEIARAALARDTAPVQGDLVWEHEAGAVVLRFGREIPAGTASLELEFSGPIRDDLKALYRSTRGTERYAITSLWP